MSEPVVESGLVNDSEDGCAMPPFRLGYWTQLRVPQLPRKLPAAKRASTPTSLAAKYPAARHLHPPRHKQDGASRQMHRLSHFGIQTIHDLLALPQNKSRRVGRMLSARNPWPWFLLTTLCNSVTLLCNYHVATSRLTPGSNHTAAALNGVLMRNDTRLYSRCLDLDSSSQGGLCAPFCVQTLKLSSEVVCRIENAIYTDFNLLR